MNTSGLMAELLVPEKEIDDVKQGSIVWMKVGALRNADFEGRVDSIAPVTQTVEGEQMIVVRSQLSGENENLKPGMTGCGPDLRRQTSHHQDRHSADGTLVKDGVRSPPSLREPAPVHRCLYADADLIAGDLAQPRATGHKQFFRVP